LSLSWGDSAKRGVGGPILAKAQTKSGKSRMNFGGNAGLVLRRDYVSPPEENMGKRLWKNKKTAERKLKRERGRKLGGGNAREGTVGTTVSRDSWDRKLS